MADQEKLNLTWDTYSDHMREALKEMMTSSEFADVTLVTDDKKQIRAHRNILSACSPVFKKILQVESYLLYSRYEYLRNTGYTKKVAQPLLYAFIDPQTTRDFATMV